LNLIGENKGKFVILKLFLEHRRRLDRVPVRYWIDEGIKVEGRQVGVLGFDKHDVGSVIPRQVDEMRQIVVQVGKSDSVFCPDWLSNDDLVDVVELVPIVVESQRIFDERFVLWPARDRYVEALAVKNDFRSNR
jgi:hypothetical protein